MNPSHRVAIGRTLRHPLVPILLLILSLALPNHGWAIHFPNCEIDLSSTPDVDCYPLASAIITVDLPFSLTTATLVLRTTSIATDYTTHTLLHSGPIPRGAPTDLSEVQPIYRTFTHDYGRLPEGDYVVRCFLYWHYPDTLTDYPPFADGRDPFPGPSKGERFLRQRIMNVTREFGVLSRSENGFSGFGAQKLRIKLRKRGISSDPLSNTSDKAGILALKQSAPDLAAEIDWFVNKKYHIRMPYEPEVLPRHAPIEEAYIIDSHLP